MRRRIESAVTDLPLPDSPTMPRTSPSPIEKLTPSTTTARAPLCGKLTRKLRTSNKRGAPGYRSSRPAGLQAMRFQVAQKLLRTLSGRPPDELVVGVRDRNVTGPEHNGRDLGVIDEQSGIAPNGTPFAFASRPVTSEEMRTHSLTSGCSGEVSSGGCEGVRDRPE